MSTLLWKIGSPSDGRGPATNPLKGHQNVKLRQPLELWSKRGQEDAFYMS